ncbi:MAG: TIGR03842 family LLM class F420-dependent oxidoreductase, partial [Pseudomonadota bacterium]
DNPYLDFITDDIIDGFAVLGTPDDHIAKLKVLEEVGITQFNIYLDNGDEENIIAEYGRTVIPALS